MMVNLCDFPQLFVPPHFVGGLFLAFLLELSSLRISWVTALLGWLFLLANSSIFILTHMVLGTTFALLLLALSLIQLLTGRMHLLGATGIVYTLILTVLGFTQTGLLEGLMHWLIQTAHVGSASVPLRWSK